MSGSDDTRHGIVHIAEEPAWIVEGHGVPRFGANWDAEDDDHEPALLAVEGFGTAEEAVLWGRERARRVLVRLGEDTFYSAGDERLSWDDGLLPEWAMRSS